MKFIFVVHLTALVVLIDEVSSKNANLVLSKAFANLTEMLVTSSNQLATISVSDNAKSATTALLKQLFAEGVPQYVRYLTASEEGFELDSSAFIVAESIEKLTDFNQKVNLTNKYSKPFQFFVYCHDATIENIA